MKRVSMLSVLCIVVLSGCEMLRATVKSKAVQDEVIGALLGAGIGALSGSISDHHRGLGAWIGGGAALGGLAGWVLGNIIDQQHRNTEPQPIQ